MARRKSPWLKVIRSMYRALSVVNTAGVIMSGNPGKIAKHIARKRAVKFGGRIVK